MIQSFSQDIPDANQEEESMNTPEQSILQHPSVITDFSQISGRILIMGGSFDPIQRAHIDLAQQVKAALNLDHVVFIPAYQNPLKEHAPVPGIIRTEMILQAIENIDGFHVSPLELERGEETGKSSYTIDTISNIHTQIDEESELFIVIGGDNIKDLHRWSRIHDLFSLAQFVTVPRREEHTRNAIPNLAVSLSDKEIESLQSHFVDITTLPISSTQVREAAKAGKDISSLVPEGVDELIEQYDLYS